MCPCGGCCDWGLRCAKAGSYKNTCNVTYVGRPGATGVTDQLNFGVPLIAVMEVVAVGGSDVLKLVVILMLLMYLVLVDLELLV